MWIARVVDNPHDAIQHASDTAEHRPRDSHLAESHWDHCVAKGHFLAAYTATPNSKATTVIETNIVRMLKLNRRCGMTEIRNMTAITTIGHSTTMANASIAGDTPTIAIRALRLASFILASTPLPRPAAARCPNQCDNQTDWGNNNERREQKRKYAIKQLHYCCQQYKNQKSNEHAAHSTVHEKARYEGGSLTGSPHDQPQPHGNQRYGD
jgi:hypothetical protein